MGVLKMAAIAAILSAVGVTPAIAQQRADGFAEQRQFASSEGQRQQADAYAKHFRVSSAEAADRMEAFSQSAALGEKIKDALDGRFAGMWIDHAQGIVNVGVAPRDDHDRPDAALPATAARQTALVLNRPDAAALAKRTRFVEVAHPTSTLIAAQKTIADAREGTPFSVGVDNRHNRLVLSIPQNAPAGVRTTAAEARQRADVPVKIATVDPEELNVTGQQCTSQRRCDRPLRGGVEIRTVPATGQPNGLCSVTGISRTYNIWTAATAGHCLEGLAQNRQWEGITVNHGTQLIGRQVGWTVSSTFGDFGFIAIDNPYWLSPAPPRANMYGIDSNHPIQFETTAHPQDLPVCRMGISSGVRCGLIAEYPVSVTVTYNHPAGGTYTRTIWPAARANRSFGGYAMCSIPGDSGGPVMHWTYLMGIHVAAEGTCQDGLAHDTYYMGADWISWVMGGYFWTQNSLQP